jgi:hypothetical protein
VRIRGAILLAALIVMVASTSFADSFIYANNASYGAPYVLKIDKSTGAIVQTYTNLSGQNGRGVVIVGNTMYYTSAYSGAVYSYDLATSTDNGVLFTVAGASGLSTIAYDGTNFWIGDYSGTNHAFLYTPTGTLLNTISLSNCSGYCDGLEYLAANGGELISNRFDGYDSGGSYDLYDTSGNLLQASFITTGNDCSTGATGIAFDGTYFFVSCINTGKLEEYDVNGNYVATLTLTGSQNGYPPYIEDLSADYAQVLGPPTVPEPSSFLMFGSGLVGLAGVGRDRLRRLFRR